MYLSDRQEQSSEPVPQPLAEIAASPALRPARQGAFSFRLRRKARRGNLRHGLLTTNAIDSRPERENIDLAARGGQVRRWGCNRLQCLEFNSRK